MDRTALETGRVRAAPKARLGQLATSRRPREPAATRRYWLADIEADFGGFAALTASLLASIRNPHVLSPRVLSVSHRTVVPGRYVLYIVVWSSRSYKYPRVCPSAPKSLHAAA